MQEVVQLITLNDSGFEIEHSSRNRTSLVNIGSRSVERMEEEIKD